MGDDFEREREPDGRARSAESPHPLDVATRLEGAPGDAVRRGRTSDAYWTFIGPFGGASAATALRAVLEHPHREGDPLALTVNFCAPIARGGFDVRATRVRANRSSQHWSVEFSQGTNAEVVLFASVVLAQRRETWRHQPVQPPRLPAWQGIEPFDASKSLAWVRQYELRFVEGIPELGGETIAEPPRSARSLLWLRDAQPRTLDFVSLASMSDAFFGRIFQVIGSIPPFGTVSMTTYFHAAAEELAAHGEAPLIGSVDARVFHRSFGDQTAEIFAADGRLLATAVQIAYFRV